MNPFELTKDPDGGGTTVRVKHDFVVLTREEEKQITERITEILTENAKLRELVLDFYDAIDSVFWDGEWETKERFKQRMRDLGIEVDGHDA